jgi:hypothetical protein
MAGGSPLLFLDDTLYVSLKMINVSITGCKYRTVDTCSGPGILVPWFDEKDVG